MITTAFDEKAAQIRFLQNTFKDACDLGSSLEANLSKLIYIYNKVISSSLMAALKDPGIDALQRLKYHVFVHHTLCEGLGVAKEPSFIEFHSKNLMMFGPKVIRLAQNFIANVNNLQARFELLTPDEFKACSKVHFCFVKLFSQYHNPNFWNAFIVDTLFKSLEACPTSYLKRQYRYLEDVATCDMRIYKIWVCYLLKIKRPRDDIVYDRELIKLISIIKNKLQVPTDWPVFIRSYEKNILARLACDQVLLEDPYFLTPDSLIHAQTGFTTSPQYAFLAAIYFLKNPHLSQEREINLSCWSLPFIKSWLQGAIVSGYDHYVASAVMTIAAHNKQDDSFLSLLEICIFYKNLDDEIVFAYFTKEHVDYIPQDRYLAFMTKLLKHKKLDIFLYLHGLRPLDDMCIKSIIEDSLVSSEKVFFTDLFDYFPEMFSDPKYARFLYDKAIFEGSFDLAGLIKKECPSLLSVEPIKHKVTKEHLALSVECRELMTVPNLDAFDRMYKLCRYRLSQVDKVFILDYLASQDPSVRFLKHFHDGFFTVKEIVKIFSSYNLYQPCFPLDLLDHPSIKTFSKDEVVEFLEAMIEKIAKSSFFAALFLKKYFAKDVMLYVLDKFSQKSFYLGLQMLKYCPQITQEDWNRFLLGLIEYKHIKHLKVFLHPNFPKLSPDQRQAVMDLHGPDQELMTTVNALFWDAMYQVSGQSTEFSSSGLQLVVTSPMFNPRAYLHQKMLQKVALSSKK